MKKVILSLLFIVFSNIVYSQVFSLRVDNTTVFKHEFKYGTIEALDSNKLEILGGIDYQGSMNIVYDLSNMIFTCNWIYDGKKVFENGRILNINPTNAIMNIDIESFEGQKYHVLIDHSEDYKNIVIYVRWSIIENKVRYIKGWTTTNLKLSES
jgi:hypothetical protein